MRICKISFNEKYKEYAVKTDILLRRVKKSIKKPLENNEGWGKEEIIGTAIVLVIAAFVVVPELREFAESIMTSAKSWWDNAIKSKIFSTS